MLRALWSNRIYTYICDYESISQVVEFLQCCNRYLNMKNDSRQTYLAPLTEVLEEVQEDVMCQSLTRVDYGDEVEYEWA